MFREVRIAETGAARSQLKRVLARKLSWFAELENTDRDVTLVHPLVARITLPDSTVSRLQQTALRLMETVHGIYGAADKPMGDLTALAKTFADHMTSYPNVTPGGVVQSRPFFEPSMQAFQTAWRDVVLQAARRVPVSAIQRFTNLRVVPGRRRGNEDERPYATTTTHSDIWIGEPIDSVNGWLALCGDTENTVIEFFHCEPGFLAGHFGHEARYDTVQKKLEDAGITFSPLGVPVSCNTLYLFDCLVPHRTCRGDGGVRLSIDGRLRTGILDGAKTRGPLPMTGREALQRQYVAI